jgi:formylglycine-generating enzyme required for sulfatase activity
MEHILTGIVLLLIPGGRYRVGARTQDLAAYEWESPVHRPKVLPFYLGRSPVTQEQWRRVIGNSPSKFRGRYKPVESVSRHDVFSFLRAAGSNLRLPTELEWEKGARGGTKSIFWWGDEFHPGPINCMQGTRRRRRRGGTTDVTDAAPNGFGLVDVLGNVSEWVDNDWFHHRRYWEYRLGGDVWDVDDYRMGVVCGGSWRDPPMLVRCSERLAWSPDDRQPFIGFRVARDVVIVEKPYEQ